MIKNIFLNHKGKSTTASKEHCTYLDASQVGILYHADDFPDQVVTELENQLKADGKNVARIGYVEKATEQALLFSKKDISGTGTIKKNQLSFFINQSFDFLISLDTSGNINYKYVLALSKATCKVGFETEQYYDLLQMSVKMEENKSDAMKSIIRYLKMI
ncbi:DUF6913 domain-containing protein [Ekhidna sp.]